MLQQQQALYRAAPTVPGTTTSPSVLQSQVMNTAFSQQQQIPNPFLSQATMYPQQQIPNPFLSQAAIYPGSSIGVQSPSSFPYMLQRQSESSSAASSNIPSNTRSPTELRPDAERGSAASPSQRPAMCSPIHEKEKQCINDALDLLVASRESSDKNEKPSDEDLSEFLMSALHLSGIPRLSDYGENEETELTDEEKATALSDVFGKYCNVDTHKNKRARRDLEPEPIAFLVKHVRNEIAKIPNDEKQALIEAQEKCEAEEFSDARLEQFLRCVEMDLPRAIKRFVMYWKMRRELFGPDKFILPMTLSGALRDDLVALETGWLSILPKCDLSGRQLLYTVPSRHKREGYTSESLLRAGWYVIEVASKQPNASIVNLVWDKDSTLFDFDRYLYEQMSFFKTECWPVKFECRHLCCTRNIAARVLIPVVLAFQSKQWRARFVVHDVPHEEIVSALSEYGITKEMLPSDTFRGTLQFDHSEWIAQRRAAELKEI